MNRVRITEALESAELNGDTALAHDLRIDLEEYDFECRVSNEDRLERLEYGDL